LNSGETKFVGIPGNSIRIEAAVKGIMSVCDIKVQKAGHKHSDQADFKTC